MLHCWTILDGWKGREKAWEAGKVRAENERRMDGKELWGKEKLKVYCMIRIYMI
jgi:hypothetical protein